MKVRPTNPAREASAPASAGRARPRQSARDTAAHRPRPAPDRRRGRLLRAADLAGVCTTGLLVDGRDAQQARRQARQLGLPWTLDDTSAWAALGALAVLLRVVDDGSRRSIVIDTAGPRSLFSRWADAAGFVPLPVDVTDADTIDRRIDDRCADLVVRLHPHSPPAADADLAIALGAHALRPGGVLVTTLRLGPADEGGLGLADLRSLVARVGEQGLRQLGSLDITAHQRARAVQTVEHGSFGLALLAFRRT